MTSYYIKRILWFFPSLFLLMTFVFLLSKFTNKDAVEAVLSNRGVTFDSNPNYQSLYKAEYYKNKQHFPSYYFSILPNHYPDTLNRIVIPKDRAYVKKLLEDGYTMEAIGQINTIVKQINQDSAVSIYNIYSYSAEGLINSSYSTQLKPDILNRLKEIVKNKKPFHWPKFSLHGFENQFHYWLKKVVRGDWGESYLDGSKVKDKVKRALSWTMTLMVIDLFLMFIIGVPIVFLAVYKKGFVGQLIEWTSMLFYVIPIFWLATLVQVFLMNPDYGLNLFPIYQEDYLSTNNFTTIFNNYFTKYLPAVFCLVLTNLAVFIRILKGNVVKESFLPYVDTALSKGASRFDVLRKHILPNTLIPLITILIGSIPLFITGSLIIEVIFNIPGMGRLMYNSILKADWSVVYFVVMLIGVLTSIFYLIGDLLYQYFDPKIKFK